MPSSSLAARKAVPPGRRWTSRWSLATSMPAKVAEASRGGMGVLRGRAALARAPAGHAACSRATVRAPARLRGGGRHTYSRRRCAQRPTASPPRKPTDTDKIPAAAPPGRPLTPLRCVRGSERHTPPAPSPELKNRPPVRVSPAESLCRDTILAVRTTERRPSMRRPLPDMLHAVYVTAPQQVGPLQVFGVRSEGEGCLDYITLDDAL